MISPSAAKSVSLFSIDGSRLATVPLTGLRISGYAECAGIAVRFECYDELGMWVAGGTIGDRNHDDMQMGSQCLMPNDLVEFVDQAEQA